MKGYYHFTIFEPKRREIYAAHYQDRVVLHCICDEVLKRALAGVVKDVDVQRLLFHYIDSYDTPGCPGKGLPLGNQSSQTFAIYYLDPVDRLVKEKLRVKYYVRYMDDWLLLHHDREFLKECLRQIEELVSQELKLELNEKTQIFRLSEGIEFLGWRFFLADGGAVIRKMKRQSRIRMKRRLKKLQKDYEAGLVTKEEVRACRVSYEGHLSHGNTYELKKRVFRTGKK